MRARTLIPSLILAAGLLLPSALRAKECQFRELAGKEGLPVTITARITEIHAEEDNPRQLYITVDNTGTDHCFSYLTRVPKSSLGACAVGKTVTATGRVQEGMDAWWGLEKVKSIACQ